MTNNSLQIKSIKSVTYLTWVTRIQGCKRFYPGGVPASTGKGPKLPSSEAPISKETPKLPNMTEAQVNDVAHQTWMPLNVPSVTDQTLPPPLSQQPSQALAQSPNKVTISEEINKTKLQVDKEMKTAYYHHSYQSPQKSSTQATEGQSSPLPQSSSNNNNNNSSATTTFGLMGGFYANIEAASSKKPATVPKNDTQQEKPKETPSNPPQATTDSVNLPPFPNPNESSVLLITEKGEPQSTPVTLQQSPTSIGNDSSDTSEPISSSKADVPHAIDMKLDSQQSSSEEINKDVSFHTDNPTGDIAIPSLPIPKAPPLPPSPLTKPQIKSQSSPQIAYTEQIKQLGNSSGDANLKPSEVKTLMNKSGKVFETSITPYTTVNDISETQLIEEAKKREILKEDKDHTETTVKLIDGSSTVVGTSKNGIKLTPLGSAYNAQYTTQNPPPTYLFNKDDLTNGTIKFQLIAPPKILDTGMVETGLQKHLLAVHLTKNDEYFALIYLTSKNNGKFFCDQQFKNFQNETTSSKKQNIVPLNSAVKLDKNDIQILAQGEEYLKKLPVTSVDLLNELWDELKEKPYVLFNKEGITKENLLKMIQAHDDNIEKGKPHPMTDDQIKQQQKGKEEQQAKQKAAKANKQKQSVLNDN